MIDEIETNLLCRKAKIVKNYSELFYDDIPIIPIPFFGTIKTAKIITIGANRPSGKKGSKVIWVPKAKNYNWDKLIWILYDKNYVMQEAWEWDVESYKTAFAEIKRLSPEHYRKGKCLYKV